MGVRDQIREMREKHDEQIAALRKECDMWKARAEAEFDTVDSLSWDLHKADEVICDMEEMLDLPAVCELCLWEGHSIIKTRRKRIEELEAEAALHDTTEAAHIAEQDRLRARIEELEFVLRSLDNVSEETVVQLIDRDPLRQQITSLKTAGEPMCHVLRERGYDVLCQAWNTAIAEEK